LTIAIATGRPDLPDQDEVPPTRGRRRWLRRLVIGTATTIVALVAVVGSWVAVSIYRIDHAVHHVVVPASLLARGKDDLLAIIKGPDHTEQVFVFHNAGGRTKVLQFPGALALPLGDGHAAPLRTLNLHAPTTIIAGLRRLGIPVTHYVGVDLHMVSPDSSLGRLATGHLSVTSLISDPTGTSSLLEQVASHIYLGPGTPVSAVLTLMNVPTAHPVSVPTDRGPQGQVVLASAFTDVLRGFL
jgi:hypothetical protein